MKAAPITDTKPNLARQTEEGVHKVWSYLGKVVGITKQVLRAISKSCRDFSEVCSERNLRIAHTIDQLSCLSIISLYYSVKNLPRQVKNLTRDVRLGDREGVAHNFLGTAILVADVVETVNTLSGAIDRLGILPKATLFSGLGSIFGIGISALTIVLRSVKLAGTAAVVQDFDQLLADGEIETVKLRVFLNNRLGSIAEANTKEGRIRRAHLERRVGKAATEAFADLQKIAENSPEKLSKYDITLATELVKKTRKKGWLEIAGHIAIIAASVITIVGIALLLSTVTVGILPYVLLASAFALRLSHVAFSDTHLKN